MPGSASSSLSAPCGPEDLRMRVLEVEFSVA